MSVTRLVCVCMILASCGVAQASDSLIQHLHAGGQAPELTLESTTQTLHLDDVLKEVLFNKGVKAFSGPHWLTPGVDEGTGLFFHRKKSFFHLELRF